MRALYSALNISIENPQAPCVSYLYDCQPLPCAQNTNGIPQAVDDAARSF